MSSALLWFSNIANVVALVALVAIVLLSIYCHLQGKDVPPIDEAKNYIKYSKIAGILFIGSAWLMASGSTPEQVITSYQAVADNCLMLGEMWIVLAFVIVGGSIYITLKKREKIGNSLIILNAIRNGTLGTGITYLLLSFLLSVK